MYIPSSFEITDLDQLHSFMERHSFATVVSQQGQGFEASHLPILLDRSHGAYGRLVGHMARANPQWREADEKRVLTIFNGPHAYISPTWYASANVVPTWNYVAIHANGVFRVTENADELRRLIERTVDFYEAGQPTPWRMHSQNPAFIDQLLTGIVGFTIELDSLEGKWKLSQNHSIERRQRVIVQLEAHDDDDSRHIATLMQQTLH